MQETLNERFVGTLISETDLCSNAPSSLLNGYLRESGYHDIGDGRIIDQ
jgi:hypothetical protein